MMRFVLYRALAGVLVPMAIMIMVQLENWTGEILIWKLDLISLILWPSSILTMAIHGESLSSFGILVVSISVGLNVVLYSALGAASWFWFGQLRN